MNPSIGRDRTLATSLTPVFGLALCALAPLALPQGKGHGGGGGGGGGGALPAHPDIAYVQTKGGMDLMLLDTQSGEVGTLVDDAMARSLAWSPDGSELAYYRIDTDEIRVVSTDGSGTERVVVPAPIVAGAGSPGLDWSRGPTPNGSEMLLFTTTAGIWTVALDGTGLLLLAPSPAPLEYFEGSPIWSPDGTRFVVSVTTGPGSPKLVFDVALVAGELSVVAQTPVPHPDGWISTSQYDWSNDGAWIVGACRELPSYQLDLWRVDPDVPTSLQRVTNDGYEEDSVGYDASDARLFFILCDGPTCRATRLYSVDAQAGGEPLLESGAEKYVGRFRARRDAGL